MKGRKRQLPDEILRQLERLLRLRERVGRRLSNKALARRFNCTTGVIEAASKRLRGAP